MGAIATLAESELTVEPGQQVTTALRVRSVGSIVDEFTFEVLGDAAGWARVEPDSLRLMPGTEEQVEVTFHPPRTSAARAGQVPFGLKVNSREDPDGSAVEEGTLQVGEFLAVTAELIPRTARGRWRAKQELAVDNRGNERLNTEALASDENEALNFELAEPTIVAEPGHATFTTLTLAPRERFWRGPDRTIPFQLQLQPSETDPPVSVDGSLLQQALIPKWLPKALLALLLLLLLLVLFWWTVLRPAIESAARDAVDDSLAEQAAATAQLQADVAGIQEAVGVEPSVAVAADDGTTDGESVGGEAAADGGEPGSSGLRGTGVRTPTDFRIGVLEANPGANQASTSVTPDGDDILEISDIILQNPSGNVGILQVQRGESTLIEVALENFRDLDYHFVVPLNFTSDAGVRLRIVCSEVTGASNACGASALFSGQTVSIEGPG